MIACVRCVHVRYTKAGSKAGTEEHRGNFLIDWPSVEKRCRVSQRSLSPLQLSPGFLAPPASQHRTPSRFRSQPTNGACKQAEECNLTDGSATSLVNNHEQPAAKTQRWTKRTPFTVTLTTKAFTGAAVDVAVTEAQETRRSKRIDRRKRWQPPLPLIRSVLLKSLQHLRGARLSVRLKFCFITKFHDNIN